MIHTSTSYQSARTVGELHLGTKQIILYHSAMPTFWKRDDMSLSPDVNAIYNRLAKIFRWCQTETQISPCCVTKMCYETSANVWHVSWADASLAFMAFMAFMAFIAFMASCASPLLECGDLWSTRSIMNSYIFRHLHYFHHKPFPCLTTTVTSLAQFWRLQQYWTKQKNTWTCQRPPSVKCHRHFL